MQKHLIFILAFGFTLSNVLASNLFAMDDGAAILKARCSACHSVEKPKSKQKTIEQWEATVSRMMTKGAQLTAEEKQILVDYLSKTYKP